jgi:hypothetical protein
MMSASPFQNSEAIDQRFITKLREIRETRPDCQKLLACTAATSAPAITEFMREVRTRSLEDRKQIYIEQRLREQKSWYCSKAATNARASAYFFWIAAGLQGLAVVMAIILAVSGNLGFNIVPVLTTCGASVAAWNQMKRHDELAKTYAFASQELGEFDAIATSSATQRDFPQFVEQVEEAISREHTMWCARRDIQLPQTGSGAS